MMNIEKYYRQSATAYLNASIISCLPVIFFLAMFLSIKLNRLFLLLIIPFCLYSITAFASYLLQKRRCERLANTFEETKVKSLLQSRTVLLSFLPAPSLRMLIFDGEGLVLGEIRDEKFALFRWYLPAFLDGLRSKTYGFYNGEDMLQYQFTMRKQSIEIRNRKNQLISKMDEKKTDKAVQTIYIYDDKQLVLKRSLAFTDYRLEKEGGLILANVKKGWMPKDWQKRFLDPNHPVVTIHHSAANKDIIHIYAILAKIFAYKDH
ncbi:hypothetical protein [Niallia circulans]|nr:hypothetical protein [Niallia circulans]